MESINFRESHHEPLVRHEGNVHQLQDTQSLQLGQVHHLPALEGKKRVQDKVVLEKQWREVTFLEDP